MKNFVITTYYKFVELKDADSIRAKLLKFCMQNGIKGTILLACEGINSTITGKRDSIDKFYGFIKSVPEFSDLTYKESYSDDMPFKKLKVKVRKEIVTFKMPLNMKHVGERLDAAEWDNIISREDAIVIDTRNDYEVLFGTFRNAINPKTRNFTDLPDWVGRNLRDADRNRPVAMFCTGGIRCEKSTAYMKSIGFKKVYHLNGGVLQYLEDTKGKENMWQGKCFVFDDRIAVDADLKAI